MENPDKVVFKNKFYPRGITKQQLVDHYMKNKDSILKECRKRPIVFFISFEPDKPLVVQRNVQGKLIHLNNKNYDTLVSTGNVLSLAGEIPDPTDFWVIDVDCKVVGDNRKKIETIDDILKVIGGYVNKYKVFNSTSGFHVYGYLNKKVNKLSQKVLIEKLLENHLSEKYKIGNLQNYDSLNVTYSNINLDLSPMNDRGCIIIPGALTREGIICTDITRTYSTWNPKKGLIK